MRTFLAVSLTSLAVLRLQGQVLLPDHPRPSLWTLSASATGKYAPQSSTAVFDLNPSLGLAYHFGDSRYRTGFMMSRSTVTGQMSYSVGVSIELLSWRWHLPRP